MKHTLHPASKAFIKIICTTLSSYKKKEKGLKKAGSVEDKFEEDNKVDGNDGDDNGDDNKITWLTGLCNLGPASEDKEIDDVVD